MINLTALSGAPFLVLVYVVNLFLTNFGFNLYPAFTIFSTYGTYYIISTLNNGQGLNKRNKYLFSLHLVLLFYGFFMFYLYEVGLLERETPSWWGFNSLLKFISIIIASLAVIVTPMGKIIKSISIIKNISYFMILGAIIYYVIKPLGINFLSSDELAGYRYNGGVNSYIQTGQFLIAGFISHVLLYQKSKLRKILFAALLFTLAIFATQDRTSIGALLIIFGILFFRSGFGLSPFNFQIKKSVVILFLIPAILGFGFLQYQNFTSGNFESYKSVIHRLTISLRSYELFQETLPAGSGPGSQTFLMNENRINLELFEEDEEVEGLSSLLVNEVDSFQANVGSGLKLSPHNTYVDFLVPFGLMGLFFVICVIGIQLGAMKRILFNKNNSTVILDSFAISAFLFLMLSSLFNLWWLYLIFYRILISEK